jgi:hypothetical protein
MNTPSNRSTAAIAQARRADKAGFNPYGIIRPCAMCPFRVAIQLV